MSRNNLAISIFQCCFLFINIAIAVSEISSTSPPSIIRLPLGIRQKLSYSGISSASKHLASRDTVSLYNDEGTEYLVTIGIGTPPQNFTVALDTGSADLWIPSIACQLNDCILARFDPQKSSTYIDTNYPFSIVYGIGDVRGYYGMDTVKIGEIKVPMQQFGLADATKTMIMPYDTNDDNKPLDLLANGILGLGFSHLSSAGISGLGEYDPFIINLAKNGLIPKPVFSVFMNSYSSRDWSGELFLGGVVPSKFKGKIVYAPVTPSSKTESDTNKYTYWMVSSQFFKIVDNQTKFMESSFEAPKNLIIDTGATLTYVDKKLAKALVIAAVGDGNWEVDNDNSFYMVNCNAYKSKKRLEIGISQTIGRISSTPIILSIPVKDLIFPFDSDIAPDDKKCSFGIAAWSEKRSVDKNSILVGDSILRSMYLVFDMGNHLIGFSQAVGSTSTVTGPEFNLTSTSESKMSLVQFMFILAIFILL
ncbi:aspartic peptidase domain-containing protein [Spinellus fusiger]|nr:aspartic peptidase domain-containing protein [Spinellus fusiger]